MVRLVRDYRSTPQVVGLANRLLRAGPRRGRGRLRLELVAQRAARPGAGVHASYADEPAEAAGVAAAIAAADRRRRAARSEIAVLFRINAQSEAYEQALAEAGVPYVAARRRAVLRAAPRSARRCVLLRGAARVGATPATPLADAVARRPVGGGLDAEHARRRGGAVRERWESLAALVAARRGPRRGAARGATLADFVAELDERAAAQHAPTVEGVTLASLHAAKGLEWDAVFLVGLVEGTLPIIHADDPTRRSRRSAGCSTSASPGPASTSRCPGRGPRARAAGRPAAVALPRRAAPGRRRGRREPCRRARSGAAARRAAMPTACRVCGAPLLDRRRAQARPLRRLPADLRRGAVRAAARVAAGAGRRPERPGVRRLHRRDADRARRAPARPTVGELVGDRRHRRAQARALRRRRCSRCWPASDAVERSPTAARPGPTGDHDQVDACDESADKCVARRGARLP